MKDVNLRQPKVLAHAGRSLLSGKSRVTIAGSHRNGAHRGGAWSGATLSYGPGAAWSQS